MDNFNTKDHNTVSIHIHVHSNVGAQASAQVVPQLEAALFWASFTGH